MIIWEAIAPVRQFGSEPYALRRIAFGKSTGDKAVEVFALTGRQGRERRFEDRADYFLTLAKRRLATRGEPLTDGPPWSYHAFDHSSLDEAIRQRTEGLVTLECHLSEGVGGRVRARGNRAKGIPLRQRGADLSQLAVHDPMVTVLELLDGSAQVLERDGHSTKVTSPI